MPIQGGAWALPMLHPDIPFVLTDSTVEADEIALAKLAIHAHKLGVPLRAGRYQTTTKSLIRQLQHHLNPDLKETVTPRLGLVIQPEGSGIHVNIDALGLVPVFRLKPLVDELNAYQPGLGLWVLKVANSVRKDVYPIFDFTTVVDAYAYSRGVYELTDESYAETLNEQEGTQRTIDELRDEYEEMWPSDLFEVLGGHKWVITGIAGIDSTPLADIPTDAQVSAFAKACTDQRLSAILTDFIQLKKVAENRDTPLSTVDRPICNYTDEPLYDFLGASCFLVWDEVDPISEIVSHHEENLMNGGEATETHAVFKVPTTEPDDLTRVVDFINAYAAFHKAVAGAFKHFEILQ